MRCQPLSHQEDTHQEQGPRARGRVARAACDLAVQGQDQPAQTGQAGLVQQQEGGLHGRRGLQPVRQPQVGVLPQGQPQPEPGLVVVREGGHRGHAVDTPCQEHGQGVAHAPRVARIGEGSQLVGQGAQGLQEGGVVACDNVFHEGCSVSREVVKSLHKTHGGPLCCARDSLEPVADMDYPYGIVCDMRQICFVSKARR